MEKPRQNKWSCVSDASNYPWLFSKSSSTRSKHNTDKFAYNRGQTWIPMGSKCESWKNTIYELSFCVAKYILLFFVINLSFGLTFFRGLMVRKMGPKVWRGKCFYSSWVSNWVQNLRLHSGLKNPTISSFQKNLKFGLCLSKKRQRTRGASRWCVMTFSDKLALGTLHFRWGRSLPN